MTDSTGSHTHYRGGDVAAFFAGENNAIDSSSGCGAKTSAKILGILNTIEHQQQWYSFKLS